MTQEAPLSVKTLFESPEGDAEINQNYRTVILRILKKILPSDFFEQKETEEETREHQREIFKQVIPLITCSEVHKFPESISFFALSKYRSNSFKFFFEMISRWLRPGKRLNVVLVYASDFILKEIGDDIYTICEVMISVENHVEFEEIQRHFPVIAAEITLGMHSEFYAQRILEVKGLAADDKTSLVQGFIAFLVKRFPQTFDRDIFTEMQQILVTCRDEFKANRQPRHLSRIISVQYLFRKALKEAIRKNAQRRHLYLKIFPAYVQTKNGRKRVLSVLVGLNFVREHESFGEEHLLRAINHYIPTAQPIQHSYHVHKTDNICISNMEFEKRDGSPFTLAEMRKLRLDLPTNLKNRIEHKLHPVFMPRNEEEIMRNMLSLTNQIKYLRDIPQVIISFDEQTYSHLFFTITLARVLKDNSIRISEMFKISGSTVDYLHDRTKIMGYLRKKYPKEATVFRLKIPKENFLRTDHTIDLYKARQRVVGELFKVIGEVRDYNGGMISKEQELLAEIKKSLSNEKDYDEWLLENFFYSLAPLVIRALLDPKAFRTLFVMLLEGIKEYRQDGVYLKFHMESFHCFVIVIAEDMQVKDLLNHAIQELQIPTTELAYAYTKANGNACLGYICCARNFEQKAKFQRTIEDTLSHICYKSTELLR